MFLLKTSAITPFLSLLLDQNSKMLATGSGKKKTNQGEGTAWGWKLTERGRKTWKERLKSR